MSWREALERELTFTQAETELKAFLDVHLPVFKAPVRAGAWRREIPRRRRRVLEQCLLRGIPRALCTQKPRVVWGEVLRPDPAYVIRKLRYEIYPDYWIPGLLYEPANVRGKVPVVLNPNGHHSGGKAVIYKQIRCANLARRGMIALNLEFIGMGELMVERSHYDIAHLNLTGFAGVGLFYLALQKGLDVLVARPHADTKRVAVTGLSGGGWQTILISALDARVTVSVPVAGYTSVRARVNVPADIGDLEQTPVDMATFLDYTDLTAMLAPRPALLILNENDDCCFATARTKPVIYDSVLPTYRAFGAESAFETYSNRTPGTHNYDADNRSRFYRFLNKHFRLDTPEGDIHQEGDILPASRLNVGLPVEQETLLSLARRRSRQLAAKRRPPATARARQKLRAAVARCLRLPQYRVRDEETCRTGEMSLHRFHTGPWTVPVTASNPAGATAAELRVADAGRPHWRDAAPERGRHVYAADIFGTGENATPANLRMLAECAGHRLLGIQVAQILAAADRIASATHIDRIHLVAAGTNLSLAALLAAALRPDRFSSLTIAPGPNTFAHVVERGLSYEQWPALFCFGLLELVDLPELIALMGPVTLCQPGYCLPPEAGPATVRQR